MLRNNKHFFYVASKSRLDILVSSPGDTHKINIDTFPLGIERKIVQSHCGCCLVIFTISTQTLTQHYSARSVLLGGCLRIIHLHKKFQLYVHQTLKTEMLSLLLISFFIYKDESCHVSKTKIQEIPGFNRSTLRSVVHYTEVRVPDRCGV